jgi:5-methyltetrahydropteroyltriglutamate--homocysteine methyltransferase
LLICFFIIHLTATTTIGSFPQTKEIRVARSKFTKGELTAAEYDGFLEKEIQSVITLQEEIGLDLLVHGEPERNDMVKYFGERLDGFVFNEAAWGTSLSSFRVLRRKKTDFRRKSQ